MRATLLGTTGLVIALVLLFAVNILGGRLFATSRVDLTEHRLFTLSDGTLKTLRDLEEPITLRLYYSRAIAAQVPQVRSYASRIESLLEEYRRESDGKLSVHLIDPEPFSEEEDRAVAFGLRGAPLGDGEETLYLGLVGTNSTDDEDAIPFFTADREPFLEYDVTRLIHNLSDPEMPVVGLLSTLPMEGTGPQAALRGVNQPPWMITEQLRQVFEVRTLEPGFTSIPQDVDVLVLVHPKGLDEGSRYAIDQFVLRGGRALVFVDAYAENDQGSPAMPMMRMNPSRASELDDLLAAWGLELESQRVVADLSMAVKVRTQRDGRMVTFDYPVWLNVLPEHMSQEDIITANLGNVALGSPGSLKVREDATTTVTALIRTTDGATTFAPPMLDRNADPEALLREYEPAGTPFNLAVRVTGKAPSAFPEGAPPPAEPEPGEQPGAEAAPTSEETGEAAGSSAHAEREHLAESPGEVNLIVISDTDLLDDRFWVTVQNLLGTRVAIPSAANADMVINALDNLSGSGDLISVRNRGSALRPFDRINALRRDAELVYREKEQELMQRLQETEAKLVELEERRQGDDALVLSAEQSQALVRFRQERLRIRKDLREVRRQLRKDIEQLEAGLKFANIALVPLLIGIGGILVGAWRMNRRRPSPGPA